MMTIIKDPTLQKNVCSILSVLTILESLVEGKNQISVGKETIAGIMASLE